MIALAFVIIAATFVAGYLLGRARQRAVSKVLARQVIDTANDNYTLGVELIRVSAERDVLEMLDQIRDARWRESLVNRN